MVLAEYALNVGYGQSTRDPRLDSKLLKGVWRGNEFALAGTLHVVGIMACPGAPNKFEPSFPHDPAIGLIAVCGIHEDGETEWATLTVKEARAVARALNKAIRLATVSTKPEPLA